MPRFKRWFHVNQDIIDDPEFNQLCEKFGVAGVKFFLFLMAQLDKTDNHICLHSEFSLKYWAHRIGSTRKQCLAIYQLLIDYQWINVGVTDDSYMFIYAPNFLKYRKRPEPKRGVATTPTDAPPTPTPTPTPSLKEKSLKKDSKRKCGWPDNFIWTEKMSDYAKAQGIAKPFEEFEHFHDNALAKGYKYVDWEKAWQNWCRSPYQQQPKNQDQGFYDPEGVL